MTDDRAAGPGGDEWVIELWRGVAALLVVWAHYRPLAGVSSGPLDFAFTGVDLFFVVSGFVFAPYLFGKSISLPAFAVRRVMRIYPMYLLAVLVYAFLRGGAAPDIWWRHLLFLHTWESPAVAFALNPAFWSLPPEVEFYLLLPLMARWIRGPRTLLAATAMAAGLHFSLAWFAPNRPGDINTAYVLGVHLPGLWLEFLLGAWAWWTTSYLHGRAARWALFAIGVGGWWSLALVFCRLGDAGVSASWLWRGNLGTLAAVCFALLVAASVNPRSRSAPGLPRAAQFVGSLSYGVYLFHNAAPVLLQRLWPALPAPVLVLGSLCLTLVVAMILHRGLEAPCRRLGRRWAARLARP